MMRETRSSFRSSRALVAAAAMLSAGGCSLALDWDPNRLQCDANKACLVGYSCLGTECVKDGSVSAGGTCVSNEQCQSDLVCTPHPFLCRKPCDAYFLASGNCDRGTFCRPSRDLDTGEPIGSCVQSECTNDDGCLAGRVCVMVTDFAGTCLPSCSPSFPSGSYVDNCQSSLSAPQLCQPLGTSPGKLVCIDESDAPQDDFGPVCDYGKQTCARGSACVGGQCRPYCDPTSGQPCPGRCQAATGGEYSVCNPAS